MVGQTVLGYYKAKADTTSGVRMAEEIGFDREVEMIEVSVDLFIASLSFEEGNERAYLDHLRKAQAHLTGLILDAEMHPAKSLA
jgi:hypothetical protein